MINRHIVAISDIKDTYAPTERRNSRDFYRLREGSSITRRKKKS